MCLDYQQLVNLAPLEDEKFEEVEKDAVLFTEDAQTFQHNILNLLEKVDLFFIEKIGRQDTLKAFIKVTTKISLQYPDVKNININYKGQVTWEGEQDVTQIPNHQIMFAKLLLKLLNELSAVSGGMYSLFDIVPEQNIALKNAGFYQTYQKLLD